MKTYSFLLHIHYNSFIFKHNFPIEESGLRRILSYFLTKPENLLPNVTDGVYDNYELEEEIFFSWLTVSCWHLPSVRNFCQVLKNSLQKFILLSKTVCINHPHFSKKGYHICTHYQICVLHNSYLQKTYLWHAMILDGKKIMPFSLPLLHPVNSVGCFHHSFEWLLVKELMP